MLTINELIESYENKERTAQEIAHYIKKDLDNYRPTNYFENYLHPLFNYIKEHTNTNTKTNYFTFKLFDRYVWELQDVDFDLLNFDDEGYSFILCTLDHFADVLLEFFTERF